MKALMGTIPQLPWWRLQSMTDEEVEKFNRKHLVEIEMSYDSAIQDFEKLLKEFEIKMAGHMEAVEAIKKGTALNAFYYDRGWNAAIEAAASKAVYPAFVEAHDTEWDEGYNYARKLIEVEIRKLKK